MGLSDPSGCNFYLANGLCKFATAKLLALSLSWMAVSAVTVHVVTTAVTDSDQTHIELKMNQLGHRSPQSGTRGGTGRGPSRSGPLSRAHHSPGMAA